MNKMPLKFAKMHGLGNDFMVIDATQEKITLNKEAICQLANRHTGVGFDQLLIIEPANNADFFCRIYNSDGSEAEQCGNGLRCIARYINEHDMHAGQMSIATLSGIFPIKINDMDNITVTLAAPAGRCESIQLQTETAEEVTVSTLSMGNPHTIMKVEAVASTPVHALGPQIAGHQHFNGGTNVGFMEIVNRGHIRLRTFERGAGETHACGSNACAAAVTGIQYGWLDHRVNVEFRYGSLIIEWAGEGKPIYMSGPATLVYTGSLNNRHQ